MTIEKSNSGADGDAPRPESRIPHGVSPPPAARILAHLPNFFRLYWRLFRDPRVGIPAKVVLIAGVLYLISPIDLMPDIGLPVLGLVDDILILTVALRVFIWLAPRQVVEEQVRLIDQGR